MPQCVKWPKSCASIIWLLLLSFSSSALAQGPFIPIDHKGQAVSACIAYVPNLGQIATTDGDPASVTHASYGSHLWLFPGRNDLFSFVIPLISNDSLPNDSMVRIDMELVGELVNTHPFVHMVDPTTWVHNYYLPQCASGIEQVHGYKRVVYENVWPLIDFHLFSNAFGYKFYFVVKPGGDPTNIRLRFHGQEHLQIDVDGALKAILGNKFVRLPQAIVYQQINGQTLSVPFGADYDEVVQDQTIAIHTADFDPQYPLVFDISESFGMMGGGGGGGEGGSPTPEWGTWYSGNGGEVVRDISRYEPLGMAVCGETNSQNFPLSPGNNSFLFGDLDAYYTVFDDQYHQSVSTYYGGDHLDGAVSLAQYGNGIALLGSTRSDPTTMVWSGPTGAFVDNTKESEAVFLATFNAVGQRTWSTLFGPYGLRPVKIVAADQGSLFITGDAGAYCPDYACPILDQTNEPTYASLPICDSTGQGFQQTQFARKFWDFTWPPAGITDGFIAKFNAGRALVWSTLFGGNSYDHITDMAYDKTIGEIFISGHTLSPQGTNPACIAPLPETAGFPWCDLAGAYNQPQGNPGVHHEAAPAAFVACFNSVTCGLKWCTAYKSPQGDAYAQAISIDPVHQLVYIAGVSTATSYGPANGTVPTTAGQLPYNNVVCPFTYPYVSNSNGVNGFIAAFSRETKALLWSSMIGGGIPIDVTSTHGRVYVSCENYSPQSVPLLADPMYVYHSDPLDAATQILGFDVTGQVLGTFWGPDYAYITTAGDDLRLFAAGTAQVLGDWTMYCPPTNDPWCDEIYNGGGDLHCAQLKLNVLQVSIATPVEPSLAPLVVYPDPATTELTITSTILAADHFDILDATGRCALAGRIIWGAGQSKVDLATLRSGIYILRIWRKDDSLEGSAKFILQP